MFCLQLPANTANNVHTFHPSLNVYCDIDEHTEIKSEGNISIFGEAFGAVSCGENKLNSDDFMTIHERKHNTQSKLANLDPEILADDKSLLAKVREEQEQEAQRATKVTTKAKGKKGSKQKSAADPLSNASVALNTQLREPSSNQTHPDNDNPQTAAGSAATEKEPEYVPKKSTLFVRKFNLKHVAIDGTMIGLITTDKQYPLIKDQSVVVRVVEPDDAPKPKDIIDKFLKEQAKLGGAAQHHSKDNKHNISWEYVHRYRLASGKSSDVVFSSDCSKKRFVFTVLPKHK